MRLATKADKTLVTDILHSAFEPLTDDNSINFVVKQDDRRSQRIKYLMEYLFEKAMLFGEVYIADNEQACLLISYSDRERLSIKSIFLDIRLAFYAIGLTRVKEVLKRQQAVKKNYPTEPHIKPMTLGVRPDHQGKGTAVRLMLQVKDYVQDNHLPVIIDAAAVANVKLYEKFGFKVTEMDETLGFPLYFLRLN